MTTRFQLSAGGVVCRRNPAGQLEVVLIATQGGERWGLPKGLVEKGESLEETALREVREETGLEAEILERLEPIEYWFWWDEEGQKVRYHKKVYFFLMAYRSGDVAQHDFEVEDVRWFPIDQAIERASYRTEREVLQQVKERRGVLC
ncbi:MAG: NUDIX hydrolase [Chloroflexota bacterium]|nr:MAG: NUDIX hydrolase [Chloroflexota bacterium]